MASGLANKVRAASESDDFDLGGYDQAKCADFAKHAFSNPFPLREMIRLSFVVGGGKLVRQKYSDDLPKLFMGAMTTIGYSEDSSADCSLAAAGKFKYHHDTNKNLKFVHVYPRIAPPANTDAEDAEEEEAAEAVSGKPEDDLFTCDLKTFSRLVGEHVLMYSQKKKLLALLKERVTRLEAIEQKLTTRGQLDAEDQKVYDGPGVDEIKEKSKAISDAIQGMVDNSQLTSVEKEQLLEELTAKLEKIDSDLAQAEAEKKAKKVTALTQAKEQLVKTVAAVKAGSSAGLPPLKHEAELKKLHSKLARIAKIEKESKGNYSVEELNIISDRPELMEAIAILEHRSRGWFEDDEIFDERLSACIRAAKSAASKAGSKPASKSSGGYSKVGSAPVRPKAKSKGGSVPAKNAFAALDDSD